MKKLTLFLCTLTLAAQAAQADETPVLLDEIVVRAEADASPSLTVPSLAERRAELSQIPGGAEVVDGEKSFLRGRTSTLKDALDFAPGVYVQPRFGADESRLSIRGSGIQRTFHGRGLMLLQDGIPLNLADGSFDFQSTEPLATRSIEVFRGASALEYHGTTLGGAINFISFTGHDAPRLSARLELGSYGQAHAQVSSGLVFGPFDSYVSLSRHFAAGYQEHSRQKSERFFGNFGYRINPNLETRFYLTLLRTDSEIPGNLTKEQLEADPRQAQRNAAMPQFDRVTSNWKRDYTLIRLANRTTFEQDDHRFTLSSFWTNKDLDHPILMVIDQQSNDFGVGLRYDYTGDLAGHRNRFTLGLAGMTGILQDNRYANVLGHRGAKIGDSQQVATNLSFYLQDAFYVTPQVAVILGAQATYARRNNRDDFPVTPTDPDNSDNQQWWGWTPKLGLLWEITDTAQAYVNVSRSFEPPTFGELTAPAGGGFGLVRLQPQEATTVEVGTRGEAGRFRWDLAWYHSWVDRELLEYEVLPGLNQTVNAGRTIHQGVEAALDIDLLRNLLVRPGEEKAAYDRLLLRSVYLWNDFRFDEDPVFGNNALPGIPPHYLRSELLYEHPCGFYAGPNVEWVPQKYNVDSAETLFADPYAIIGFRVGYRSGRGFSIFFEGRNLLDKHYAATTGVISAATPANQAQFNPGDGRGFYGGIEWRW